MTEQEVKVAIGGLLHDVGKVIYRTGDGRKHSKSGYDYLKDEVGITDKQILECVLYHHADALKNAAIENDSFAYITYIADNIASATDRRKKEREDYGFEISTPLQPVFNILNGNAKELYYAPGLLASKQINNPTEQKKNFTEGIYLDIKSKLSDCLRGIEWKEQYIHSLLSALEMTLSYIPSSTAKSELADISLYDHLKLTAAISNCIYQYLEEEHNLDYHEELFRNADKFYDKEAFLLYSIDLSGIQAFIYTIHSQDALKTLRSRSFYLEIMMEHIIDSILTRIGLSRANLIYSGGGHCYMLLPNTMRVQEELNCYERELNAWLLKNYDVALFAATGYTAASANTLKNVPEGSYTELFKKVSNILSDKKAHRYTAETIKALNRKTHKSYLQECKVCQRLEHVNEEGQCKICEALIKKSKDILTQTFFVVLDEEMPNALPLPGEYYLIAESEEQLRERLKNNDTTFVRAYSKNKYYTGLNVATPIWVGDYTKRQTFEELANAAEGIKRIGILRADVDNLGQAFVGGFPEKYNTLSRTATLSRQLSLFFKYYINGLLEQGNFQIKKTDKKAGRNAAVVYSGGDDVFLVGAWNEIIEAALDLQTAFAVYTENTLTLSAGIGMYTSSYPISRIAYEVEALESMSKSIPDKNSITVLPDGEKHLIKDGTEVSDGTYKWELFKNQVILEKVSLLFEFFAGSEDRGKAFLYHLLELIRGRNDRINFARYVYLLSRMEPSASADPSQKNLYRTFSKQMYEWMQSEEDCRQLKTAINLYAYMIRERKGE